MAKTKKRIISRYKICFQTRNKVWGYKNSRLRHFYRLRSNRILKTDRKNKDFLVTKNMKWTIIRRQMVPYFRNKKRFDFNYKNIFFNKQQLKQFYGGLSEYKIRNLFKKTWNVFINHKRYNFIAALEQRVNMVIFRMKLLPTIFACTQFIAHQGILVNNMNITLPSYRVIIGDIISISEDKWYMFYEFLWWRAEGRFIGESFAIFRTEQTINKIFYFRVRGRENFFQNAILIEKLEDYKEVFNSTVEILSKMYVPLQKLSTQSSFGLSFYTIYKTLFFFFYKIMYSSLKKWEKYIPIIRQWRNPTYYKIILKTHFLKYRIKRTIFFFRQFTYKFFDAFQKVFYNKDKEEMISKFFELDLFLIAKRMLWFKMYLRIFYKINRYTTSLKKKIYVLSLKKYRKHTKIRSKNRFKRKIIRGLNKIRIYKKKRKIFKNWCQLPHWYLPSNIEFDFLTLRALYIKLPKENEVFYGFPCSIPKIISFFKERSL